MVETIVPVVYGGRARYLRAVALHLLGAAAAAAALGLILGALGALAQAPWGRLGPLIVAGIALLYFLREGFALRAIPIFDRRSQVPEWWRSFYSPPVAAFLYGVGLGAGFFTYLTFGTF